MEKIIFVFAILLLLVSCNPDRNEVEHGSYQPIQVTEEAESEQASIHPDQVKGFVYDEVNEPINGAIVRLQTTSIYSVSEKDGSFLLDGVPEGKAFRLTAFAPGFFIKEQETRGGRDGIIFHLHAHSMVDNLDYQWLSAGVVNPPSGDGSVCADCHASNEENVSLPYDEWLLDAHAQSGKNPRFLSMYNGTDLSGNRSPLTTYIIQRDYGRIPLRYSDDQPYYGPGFLLDFPESSGNCAACHMPLAAVDAPYDTDPIFASGIAKEEGINCDFCHKIWDVKLDPKTGTPYSNMPGVMSLELLRPPDGHQLFIGPFDDVAPGEDTFSPLQNQSEYCAACHFGDFWDIQIYNSFGEWLESPYSDPESGHFQTCQDCHMPPLGNDHFVQIEKSGLIRDPATIFSHKMLGASDIEFLQNTVELEVDAYLKEGSLIVDVTLENSLAGHHIPTDSPLRQILLVVEVENQNGESLVLAEGPILPEWTGDLANLPGKYYAKILEELWTEIYPSGAYWAQTRIIEDTRLAAFEIDKSSYKFDVSEDPEDYSIIVKLLYRRAFFDLMEQKGWNTPDIEMESVTIELTGS